MPNRHLSRIIIMQTLYEWDFKYEKVGIDKLLKRNIDNFKEDCDKDFINENVEGILEHLEERHRLGELTTQDKWLAFQIWNQPIVHIIMQSCGKMAR